MGKFHYFLILTGRKKRKRNNKRKDKRDEEQDKQQSDYVHGEGIMNADLYKPRVQSKTAEEKHMLE